MFNRTVKKSNIKDSIREDSPENLANPPHKPDLSSLEPAKKKLKTNLHTVKIKKISFFSYFSNFMLFLQFLPISSNFFIFLHISS